MSAVVFCPFVCFKGVLINVQQIVASEVCRHESDHDWMLEVAMSTIGNKTIQWRTPPEDGKTDEQELEIATQLFNEFTALLKRCYFCNDMALELAPVTCEKKQHD